MPGMVKLLMHRYYIWVVTIFTTHNGLLKVVVQGPDHYAPHLIYSYLLPNVLYFWDGQLELQLNYHQSWHDLSLFSPVSRGKFWDSTFKSNLHYFLPYPFLTDIITFKWLGLGFSSRRLWPEIPAWRLANLIEVFFRFSHSLQATVKILP
jgi:hypothetical protein